MQCDAHLGPCGRGGPLGNGANLDVGIERLVATGESVVLQSQGSSAEDDLPDNLGTVVEDWRENLIIGKAQQRFGRLGPGIFQLPAGRHNPQLPVHGKI
jgi:hypothetical protein